MYRFINYCMNCATHAYSTARVSTILHLLRSYPLLSTQSYPTFPHLILPQPIQPQPTTQTPPTHRLNTVIFLREIHMY